jgi:O-Antigen ligase
MSELARIAGPLGCLGLAALLVAPRQQLRLGGLAAWAVGLAGLAAYLAPTASTAKLVAAGIGGAVVALGGGWLLLRRPWLLAFATLACVPARIPVKLGSQDANLLVPLYAVVGAVAVALAWRLLRGEDGARELGPLAWPLAAFVAWTGLTLAWTGDLREGAIFLAAFVLPFGVLAIGFARLPWRGRLFDWIWAGLIGTACVYATVGAYQWARRDVFWNPKVSVGNAYAPFFRVNSVFWDPSIYGRYLVVAILTALAGILLGGVRGWRLVGLYAVVALTWLGLYLSYSQSSFTALFLGAACAGLVVWRRRALVGLVALVVFLGSASVAIPQVRHDLIDRSRSKLNETTSGRSGLIGQGFRIALAHPVQGVGVGDFKRAYAKRTGLRGKEPKKAASHTTPITVLAEEGLPGFALFAWLLAAALLATLRGLGRGYTSRVSFAVGLTLLAILVHSCLYNAFFEDPMAWALFGLAAVAARVPRRPPPTGQS